ncbi:hypothetical protein JOQ06_028626 [Pogonophryne albipinna]|uniref:Globin domain-containing protein n=1 Tax=Pogonophryne albipinna TaxID=1090488 RepID=A0AAD6FKW2_9TELE|nr:hypothetical protein JOQ06_028626 [Pogonophryne albipinna]
MPKLETLLEDGLRSDLMLKQHLKALSETLRQQLQETQRRQKEELERRIHQNSLLSTDVDPESRNEMKHQAKHLGMRKSSSTSALTSGKETLNHLRQSEKSFSPACLSSNWKNGSVRASRLAPAGTQCERFAVSKTTQEMREDEATAECQRKFCARPVPSHEKEKEKREKLIALINQDTEDQKTKATAVRKPPHKEVKDPSDSRLKDQELGRQVPTQTAVPHENRTVSGSPKLRTAERNRKEKLGFLDERPSFQPKILQRVPDFSRLHKALQTEGLRKSQSKDMIKCQPFFLRTSALPARQSRTSPEKSQLPTKTNISRSKSLGALTSLSADTLPTYITDAARKRCMAIRKSMEIRDSKNEESAEWLRKHQTRLQAMKKTITLHAKLLDPHESLKEVFNDKLQHHREADQQRMRDYMKELRDMKARVSERPYLFEQVKQKNAKAHAEQTYRHTLKTAGLKEQFVEENGEVASISEEDSDKNCSTEEDIPSREENVDGGEKIEDVEEKSVKSKVEESGMNNIPSAGEREYQEANGKGREIAASVTDKSVAELVSLTAPWGWGKREQVHQSKKFREKTDFKKVGWRRGRMEKLSEKDKELIRGSWESLGKNKVPHGVVMFSRLFELDPELLTLFHYTTNYGSTQDCLSSPEFLEHVTKVMLVIDAAVSHLDDLPSLEDFLLNLGRKHQAVGVNTQSFAEVGESLLYMLQCSLGQAYTAPLRQAWLNLYSIVVAAMSQGWAKNGEDKAD